MTHASLFSGIGGFDLAAEWAGWINAFNCEIDPFCQKILKYHFPDAEQYGDIKTADFTVWRDRIDVLTGGFPCQPFSLAGKRKGTEDKRHLWPAMLDVIRVIRPRWVVGENVLGIVNWSEGVVFEQVCSDLEAEGYEVQPYLIPACGVGAPHRRDRCWFVAHLIENAERIRCDSLKSEKEPQTGRFREPCTGDHVRVCREARAIADGSDTGVETMREGQNGVHAVGVASDAARIGRTTRSGETDGRNERAQERQSIQCTTDRPLSSGVASDTNRDRCRKFQSPGQPSRTQERIAQNGNEWNAPNPDNGRLSKRDAERIWNKAYPATERHGSIPNWDDFPTQSPVRSRNDGIPGGLDGITIPKWRTQSIKAYGNAVVPQVVLQIFETIKEIERVFRPVGE